MKLVVTGGGTGGHIYPALSVAERFRAEEVAFIGSASGPEATLAPRAGLRFYGIAARKLSRRSPGVALMAAGAAAAGLGQALGHLRRFRPDVVFGTGGYASGPVILAAALLRIPALIHEGNAIPGRTNRWLARLARRIAVTYEESLPYFPAPKTIVTGFPIRASIGSGTVERARALYGLDLRPLVFAFGGSAGAESINRAVAGALPLLGDAGLQLLHQTGRTEGAGATEGPCWYHPVPYVEAMADALAAAELVICRGGASTLAEVTAAGRPAIVVPYPFAFADHQTANAKALVAAGAAVLVRDADLSGRRLADEIRAVMRDAGPRGRMGEASRRLGRPDAAKRVADELERLATCRGGRLAEARG